MAYLVLLDTDKMWPAYNLCRRLQEGQNVASINYSLDSIFIMKKINKEI